MKRGASAVVLLLIVCLALISLSDFKTVRADGTFYIRANGSVEGTDKIQRNGDVYAFADNIYGSIMVERDNIVVDGAGYALKPQEAGDKGIGVDLRDRNNVTLINLEIAGFVGRCGILLANTNDGHIYRNNFSNNNIGIEMTARSSRNGIIKNYFENNLLGLELYSIDPGSDNIISENEIKDNDLGIVLKDFTNTNILSNKFEMNKNALFVGAGSGSKLRNNTLNDSIYGFGTLNVQGVDVDTSNTVNGKPIYYWVNQHDKTVPADAGYVALIGCTGITVENLNLAGNYYGIFLGSTTNSMIINNKLSNNLFGINLASSSNNRISENIITNNEHGVGLEADSSNNNIYGNDINANGVGIYMGDASGNSIVRNNIVNSETGIYTQYAAINTIHQNNFINNTKSWDDTGLAPFWFGPSVSVSVWDDGKEGNYWIDYDGIDLNNDGIGDTPYVIGVNNTDRYPLIKPVAIPQSPDGSSELEPFPIEWVAGTAVVIGLVFGIALLLYFKKRNRSREHL